MADTMRFGLAGYGAWGRFHAPLDRQADRRTPDGHRDAGRRQCGRRAGRLSRGARCTAIGAISSPIPRSMRSRLRRPTICTPISRVAALDAGKHVLLEKPMANNARRLRSGRRSGARSKAVLTVGFECRLSPQWGRIKSLIAEGAIGKPRHVHVALFRHPYRPGAGGWRHDNARVGSWILEEPVHFFDLALWYLADAGRPVSVKALGAGDAGMEPVISVLMRFPDGSTAAVNQILSGFGHLQTVEVTGDGGAIRATWAADTARSLDVRRRFEAEAGDRATTSRSSRSIAPGEVFELEAQAAAAVVASASGRPWCRPRKAARRSRSCLAAEQSARDMGGRSRCT